jgi:molybdopterin-guanine dinucleotide biosynthesis protein A
VGLIPLLDAVLMAGGRISGPFALAARTRVKALVPILGEEMIHRVCRALQAAPEIGRVCAVGPEIIQSHLPEGVLWQSETESAVGNLLAGLDRLSADPGRRVLVCGVDVPDLQPEPLADFLRRAPDDADLCMAVVRREKYEATYPEARNLYVPLVEGAFTAGSQYLLRPRTVRENQALLHGMFANRKSQLGMARKLGLPFVARLLTRRLTIGELERRAEELTGFRCRAVPDCRAELAYDVDSLPDLWYFEEHLRRR